MESYENFIQYLNTKKRICIVGKGMTSQQLNQDSFDLYIGIKHAILLLKQKDILIMNDLEGILGCEKIISELKYVVCPYFPHKERVANRNYTYEFVQKHLNRYKFTGKMVLYNIEKQIVIPKLMNMHSSTSGDVIFNFLNICPSKREMEIQLYGIGTTTQDNPHILLLIMANYKKNKHHKLFLDYIDRRYYQNIAPSTNNKYALKVGRKVISNFKDLNITFN
jgi:hypothetical protein